MPTSPTLPQLGDLRLGRRGLLAALGGAAIAAGTSASALAAPALSTVSWRARTDVFVRQGPGTQYHKLGVLKQGQQLAGDPRHPALVGAWRPVTFEGRTAYIASSCLVAVGTLARTDTPVHTPAAGHSSAHIPAALVSNARAVAAAVIANFPDITTMYGRRYEPGSDHMTGHAVDIMLPLPYASAANRQLGYDIAAWMQAHHQQLGVHYIIYRQHIWNVQRDAEGWRAMANRGSDTANHMDHVHVSVF